MRLLDKYIIYSSIFALFTEGFYFHYGIDLKLYYLILISNFFLFSINKKVIVHKNLLIIFGFLVIHGIVSYVWLQHPIKSLFAQLLGISISSIYYYNFIKSYGVEKVFKVYLGFAVIIAFMAQSVLISGGGIVGSFLGLELAAREIPFKIIEKNPFASSKNDHIRSLTLNLSASERLEGLGVTTESSLIKRMKIFDGSGSGKLSFNCNEANIDYLAKVFSFNDLREALTEKVESSVSIGDEITSFTAMESGIQAKLSNGSTIESDLLVIAEGRNSNLAKSIASENFSKDYEQVAKTFLVKIPELNT